MLLGVYKNRTMKTILFVMVMVCFAGCTLFRKTSRTSAVATQSSISQLESSQLVLKSAGKETQVFTYWNDSGFYQFQYIKEQVDQSGLASISLAESQRSKSAVLVKEAEPAVNWFYIGGGLLVVYFLYKWRNNVKTILF